VRFTSPAFFPLLRAEMVVHEKFVVAFFSHDVRQASKQASWNELIERRLTRMTDSLIWICQRLISAELSLPVREICKRSLFK